MPQPAVVQPSPPGAAGIVTLELLAAIARSSAAETGAAAIAVAAAPAIRSGARNLNMSFMTLGLPAARGPKHPVSHNN